MFGSSLSRGYVPQTDDIQSDHGDESFAYLRVKRKWELEETKHVCAQEQEDCDEQLTVQEE